MSRFYVQKESIHGGLITIGGPEAHHIVDVMRLKELDKVVTFDGLGNEYVGFIKHASSRRVVIEIVETLRMKGAPRISTVLIQAIPKREKMDYIAEKATELGVSTIAPVRTERTIPSWPPQKCAAQAERWRKIAREASKQCGRADVPEVAPIADLAGAISASSSCDLKMMAVLSDGTVPLKEALKGFSGTRIAIAIGPEGDFTPAEVDLARSAGFRMVSLGPRVLKSDTAGLAVLAALHHELSI